MGVCSGTLSGGAAGFGLYQGGELCCSGEHQGHSCASTGSSSLSCTRRGMAWSPPPHVPGGSGHGSEDTWPRRGWPSACALSAAQRPEQTVSRATGQEGVLCQRPGCRSQKRAKRTRCPVVMGGGEGSGVLRVGEIAKSLCKFWNMNRGLIWFRWSKVSVSVKIGSQSQAVG